VSPIFSRMSGKVPLQLKFHKILFILAFPDLKHCCFKPRQKKFCPSWIFFPRIMHSITGISFWKQRVPHLTARTFLPRSFAGITLESLEHESVPVFKIIQDIGKNRCSICRPPTPLILMSLLALRGIGDKFFRGDDSQIQRVSFGCLVYIVV